METAMQEAQDALLLGLAENSRQIDGKFWEQSIVGEQNHNNLLTSISQARESLNHDFLHLDKSAETRHGDFVRSAGEQRDTLASLNRRLENTCNIAKSNLKRLFKMCYGIKASNEGALGAVKARFQHVDCRLLYMKSEQKCMRTEMSFGFHSILPQLKMIRAMGGSLLNSLTAFSETVLDYLRRNTSTNMEIYGLLLKLQASIPNRMLPSFQDTILFEDVLSRTFHLPNTSFRH